MSIRIISKSQQGYGAFNGGQIIENKPIGFPRDGGFVRPFSNLFYWARAEAVIESTIGLHPHQGFEIMSFVLEGTISHYDTKHDAWKPLEAGDVQIIRAGDGIQHAEKLHKGAVIFQIWVDPDLSKTLEQPASYNDYKASAFPASQENGAEVTTYIGPGSPLTLDTDPIGIKRIRITGDYALPLSEGRSYALYTIAGHGTVNGQTIEPDDFIVIEGEDALTLSSEEGMDCFAVEVPETVPYRTYAQRMV